MQTVLESCLDILVPMLLQAQALELIGDLQHLRQQMNSKAVSRRNKLLREKQEIVEHIIDLGQKVRNCFSVKL